MLRLHHSPMACSLASRLALSEAGLPHEVSIARTGRGETRTKTYLSINPRGKVPALETDQGVLTESTAILPYIADLAPEAGLFPASGFERAQAQAWLSFLSSTVHVAFSGAMRPEAFEAHDPEGARTVHLGRLDEAFQVLNAHLADRDFMLDRFGVCDLYLLVFLIWRRAPGVAGNLPEFAHLDRFQQRLMARPAIAAAFAEEMKLMAEAA